MTSQGGDGRRPRGEHPMVPDAQFRSYYGRPILKVPVWGGGIPTYFFSGGLAGGCALLAAGADLTGRPALRRAGRLACLGALGASAGLLVQDLGRPDRFYNMLRVAKPTSPMSMGSWILTTIAPAAGVAAIAEFADRLPSRGPLGLVRRVLPPAGRAAGLAAAGVAPALATYTAVLLADTAAPSWHEAYPELPFVFAGSALASAAGVACWRHRAPRPPRRGGWHWPAPPSSWPPHRQSRGGLACSASPTARAAPAACSTPAGPSRLRAHSAPCWAAAAAWSPPCRVPRSWRPRRPPGSASTTVAWPP
jgi:hypothetical protein